MARPDNLHSRLVSWLKILLPLVALVMLSTLFLVSRTIDPSDAIPYSEVDIEDRVREPRITAPTYAGITSDGAALTIDAAEVRPGAEGSSDGSALALQAELDTPDGASTRLVAERGALDQASQLLRLEGGVQISTSTGYRLTTDALSAALDVTDVQSPGALAGTTPMGQITAGSMRITQDATAAGGYVIVFGNRVRLIYEPQN
ncbi:hypothetical protein FAZ78_06820 [Cereibacter changlensis]|uniref:Lipopolysaccharide export system protein LptC n=1 Tax=Cereibacter changlensis TaxID=402884 RepID=A0A4V5NLX1_9RHOB|nr:LPS export ABC transporter periplasmic protein LptC [Cereibacter changlensis]TKA97307.1 hypothetical protein FAZ78_06820 [Cereibacter changlensis]